MPEYQFHLNFSPDEFVDYYRGAARHVLVRCSTGQTVQFPASLLQKFVAPTGIQGDFVLTCDENHKCISLERLA
jgi:hypothetical protein